MMTRNSLLKKLKNDVRELEYKVFHRRLYNLKNSIIYILIKSGLILDRILPFIISATIVLNSNYKKGETLAIDEVEEKAKIEKIDTSSGIHNEKMSFDYEYDESCFQHSTAWFVNQYGLYERTLTTYNIDKSINLEDTESILKMTKEEIEDKLTIYNIERIQKNSLTEEDKMYDEDMLIIINNVESEKDIIIREETNLENIASILLIIVRTYIFGIIFTLIKKLVIKTYIKDKLNSIEPKCRPVTEKEIEELKRILALKKENLSLLEAESLSTSSTPIEAITSNNLVIQEDSVLNNQGTNSRSRILQRTR